MGLSSTETVDLGATVIRWELDRGMTSQVAAEFAEPLGQWAHCQGTCSPGWLSLPLEIRTSQRRKATVLFTVTPGCLGVSACVLSRSLTNVRGATTWKQPWMGFHALPKRSQGAQSLLEIACPTMQWPMAPVILTFQKESVNLGRWSRKESSCCMRQGLPFADHQRPLFSG